MFFSCLSLCATGTSVVNSRLYAFLPRHSRFSLAYFFTGQSRVHTPIQRSPLFFSAAKVVCSRCNSVASPYTPRHFPRPMLPPSRNLYPVRPLPLPNPTAAFSQLDRSLCPVYLLFSPCYPTIFPLSSYYFCPI